MFTMRDPSARMNVMRYGNGEALNWHFDRSEFTTTLLLQSPSAGGEFQYRSDLRTDDARRIMTALPRRWRVATRRSRR